MDQPSTQTVGKPPGRATTGPAHIRSKAVKGAVFGQRGRLLAATQPGLLGRVRMGGFRFAVRDGSSPAQRPF